MARRRALPPFLLLVTAALAVLSVVAPAASYFVGGNAFWMTDPSASSKVDATLKIVNSIGMKVVRTWAFGEKLPLDVSSGSYDFAALDNVVASAGRHGIRLILALGNNWRFGGPEKWLPGGTGAGQTIADFYADESARAKYRAHVTAVTSRYAGNPTVMGWDVINEPRCPGCDGGQLAARNSWIDDMIGAVKASAPGQMVLLASEGFYGPGSPHEDRNPGAGAICEGEDWEQDSKRASASTVHLYWRQVEGTPDQGWESPGFESYTPYLAARIDLHEQVSAQMGKQLIIEEFGLSSRFFTQDQTKAAIAVVLDRVVASKNKGGALQGALIWGIVPVSGGASSEAGYNVNLDPGAAASNVGLGSGAFAGGGGGGGGASGSDNTTASTANAASAADAAVAAAAPASDDGAASAANSTSGGRRRLRESFQDIVEDELDGFRRGPQRESCANGRAGGWSFPYAFAKASGVSAEAVKSAVAGTTISGLFKEAASKL